MSENNQCPNCGCETFITEPNQYDVIELLGGEFNIIRSESTDDGDEIFCQECGVEIDFNDSLKNGKITLKKDE